MSRANQRVVDCLTSEEHSIKSEYMSQERDSRSTLAHLGRSISKQEAAFVRECSVTVTR